MRGRRALTGVAALAWSCVLSAGVAVAAGPPGARTSGVLGASPGEAAVSGPASSSPVPQPVPGGPATATAQGRVAAGIQAVVTVPKQLPLDPPSQPLARRTIDVGIANTSGAAYTGTLQVSLTAVTAGSRTAAFPHTLQQKDDTTGAWQDVPIAADQGPTWSNAYPGVTVPAGGHVLEHFQMSAGTAPLSGIKVSVTMDGTTATTTIPVTGMTFTVSGLPVVLQAGVATPLTGTLVNSTDVPYAGVGFAFWAQACGAAGGCLQAQDILLEYQKRGVWTPVVLQTTAAGVVGTVDGSLAVKANGPVAVPLRITVAASALADGPVQISLRADGLPVPAAAAPQSVQVVPVSTLSSGIRTDPSDATPSDSASSETPSVSGPSTDTASPTDGASATDGATADAGLTPPGSGGADGSTVAILAGMGALVVSVALLGWYFVRRKQQLARAAVATPGARYPEYEEHMDHSGY